MERRRDDCGGSIYLNENSPSAKVNASTIRLPLSCSWKIYSPTNTYIIINLVFLKLHEPHWLRIRDSKGRFLISVQDKLATIPYPVISDSSAFIDLGITGVWFSIFVSIDLSYTGKENKNIIRTATQTFVITCFLFLFISF